MNRKKSVEKNSQRFFISVLLTGLFCRNFYFATVVKFRINEQAVKFRDFDRICAVTFCQSFNRVARLRFNEHYRILSSGRKRICRARIGNRVDEIFHRHENFSDRIRRIAVCRFEIGDADARSIRNIFPRFALDRISQTSRIIIVRNIAVFFENRDDRIRFSGGNIDDIRFGRRHIRPQMRIQITQIFDRRVRSLREKSETRRSRNADLIVAKRRGGTNMSEAVLIRAVRD